MGVCALLDEVWCTLSDEYIVDTAFICILFNEISLITFREILFMVICSGGSDPIPVKHPTIINASCKSFKLLLYTRVLSFSLHCFHKNNHITLYNIQSISEDIKSEVRFLHSCIWLEHTLNSQPCPELIRSVWHTWAPFLSSSQHHSNWPGLISLYQYRWQAMFGMLRFW